MLVFMICNFFFIFSHVRAQTVTELQTKINQRNDDIANLEKQIQGYQTQIDTLGSEKATLSATLKSLDACHKISR